MKHAQVYILGCIFALVSCQKDPDIPIVSLTVQDEVEAEWQTVSLSGAAVANTKIGSLYVQYSTDESMGNYTETEAQYESGQFDVVLTDLTPQSTYYYRYKASNSLNTFTTDEVRTFCTKDYIAPMVTTDSVVHVTGRKATLFGTMTFNCGKEIKEQGFEYGLDESHLIKVVADTTGFYKQMLHLQFGTKYYFRAYATSEIGTGYGKIKTFTTCDVVKFGEMKVDSITANSAKAEYTISSNGGMPVLKQGFQYWKKSSKDSTQVETNKAVHFTNLSKDQTYQLRVFAETEDSCFYSSVSEFTTKNGVISLTTATPTDVKYTSATLGGQITDDGGQSVTERGVCYATTTNPTTAHSKKTATDNIFSFTISDLSDGITYHVRAYAVNQYGTYYGEDRTFTTTAYTLPSVTTSDVSNISYTSATCGGSIKTDGGQSVTERGVCYATTTNPTTANSVVKSGSGTGSYTCNLSGLKDGTTYYVRAYAINSKGTSYGEEISFTTLDSPSIGTASVLSTSGRTSCEWVQLWENGPKWATFNVGATITDYADLTIGADPTSFYKYTELAPYYNTANVGGLYAWNNPNLNGRKTTWTSSVSTGISNVASTLWGSNWRTPTKAQLDTLYNDNKYGKTTWTWCDGSTRQYVKGCTLKGYKVTGKGDYAKYSIFLPAAGYLDCNTGTVRSSGDYGFYWSSTEYDSGLAYYLSFGLDFCFINHSNRELGLSVRAVLAE